MIFGQTLRVGLERKPIPLFRHTLCSLENRHAARKIRLRASQNAAALLFELGTVDIR
jgi:hypothetical protein